MFIFKYPKISGNVALKPSIIKEGKGATQIIEGQFMKMDGTLVDMDLVKDVFDMCFDYIMENAPWVYDVLKNVVIIYTPDENVETMQTDGAAIYVNPAWTEYIINNVGEDGVAFVLIHECMHILLDHLSRWQESFDEYPDRDRVNIATDAEINYYIENLLFDKNDEPMFEHGLIEKMKGVSMNQYGEKGLIWEEIYPLLKPKPVQPPKKIKMSDEWNKGFVDGYTEYFKSLQSKKLIEHYVI